MKNTKPRKYRLWVRSRNWIRVPTMLKALAAQMNWDNNALPTATN